MSPAPHQKMMKRLAEAKKSQIADWADGVSIEARLARPIHELVAIATKDRVRLARRFQKEGIAAQSVGKNKEAVSRHYYCLYHLFRSVVYFVTVGDDHQSHSDLGQHLPRDFPDVDSWKNTLKSARLARNSADYDLYTPAEAKWKATADLLARDTSQAMKIVPTYLKSKGLI